MMTLAQTFNDGWKEYRVQETYPYLPDFIKETLGLRDVESQVVDTWRWGTEHRDIYTDGFSYIAVNYRQSSGDESLDAYDMNVKAVDVIPKEFTVTKWVPRG